MIFRASEPATPRGDKPNREIILALLAMSFLVAVMIRYSQALWCDRLPMFCLPDRAGEHGEVVVEEDPGMAPSPGRDAQDEADDALRLPGGAEAPVILAPTREASATAPRTLPSTATPRSRSTATELATRASAGGDDELPPGTEAEGAGASSTPRATPDDGSSGDEGYPAPASTRFPTRTPSPTPEGYPGP